MGSEMCIRDSSRRAATRSDRSGDWECSAEVDGGAVDRAAFEVGISGF